MASHARPVTSDCGWPWLLTVQALQYVELLISNSTFLENVVASDTTSQAAGGGMYCESSAGGKNVLTDTQFLNNTASERCLPWRLPIYALC